MKLSEATIEILKNYATLNPSIQFRKGSELATITPTSTVLSKSRVVESFPFDLAISDLNKFLAKISLYKDSELSFEPDRVVFKSTDGRRSDYIKYSSPKVMILPPDKELTLDDPEHEFDLSAEDLLWQRKSAGISGSPYMIFHGDGKKVYIRSTDVKDDSSDHSQTEIGKCKGKFTYVIKIENWKMLEGNYRVKLKKGLSKFEHTEKPVEYYVAIEDNLSTY
jgi:hypothetical protein